MSDNQSAVKDIGGNALNFNKHRVVTHIREKIFEYVGSARERGRGEVKVVIGWVPSHRGIEGNEKADGIAKGATEEARDARFKVPARDWRSVMKEAVWKRYQARIERKGNLKGIKYLSTTRYHKVLLNSFT